MKSVKPKTIKPQTNIPLAPYTTLKIGGPADYFVIIKNQDELISALNWAQEKNLPYFILGNGSNVLVADAGFRGLVIKFQVSSFKFQKNILTAEAGASISTLAKITAEHGLAGLEFGIGIPGAIGGAIWGNAGAFGREIKDVLQSICILIPKKEFDLYFANNDNCSIVKLLNCYQNKYLIAVVDAKAVYFDYRDSIFKKHKNWIILSAEFKLKKDSAIHCQKRLKEFLQNKIASQPLGEKSAGSIFKNIITDKQEASIIKKLRYLDIGILKYSRSKIKNHKQKSSIIIPAWRLIEQVGLAGFKISGAQVSEKHANFIINTGQATAEDFIILMSLIKQKVRNKFGIQLKEEIEMAGF